MTRKTTAEIAAELAASRGRLQQKRVDSVYAPLPDTDPWAPAEPYRSGVRPPDQNSNGGRRMPRETEQEKEAREAYQRRRAERLANPFKPPEENPSAQLLASRLFDPTKPPARTVPGGNPVSESAQTLADRLVAPPPPPAPRTYRLIKPKVPGPTDDEIPEFEVDEFE